METTNICIINAPEDDKNLEALTRHLNLKSTTWREGASIDVWTHHHIIGGDEYAKNFSQSLTESDIILVLVSSYLLLAESYTLFSKWMELYSKEHEKSEKRIIPIIVSPVDWKSSPFNALQPLPRDKKPVSASKDQEQVWLNIVEEIFKIYEDPNKNNISFPKLERNPHKYGGIARPVFFMVLLLGGIIFAIYYFGNKKTPTIIKNSDAEAHEQLLNFFQKKNYSEDIRKSAAVGLCKIGHIEEVKAYANQMNDDIFNDIIKKYDEDSNNVDTFYLINNLRNIEGDNNIFLVDKNIRVSNEIRSVITKLRSNKYWLESTNLTDRERAIVKNGEIINKISMLINKLDTISSLYSIDNQSIKPKFNNTIDEFGQKMENLIYDLDSKNLKDEDLYLRLSTFDREAQKAYENFILKEDINAQINNYKQIIQLIATKGIVEAKALLKAIGESENTALSMRACAIETIGTLGKNDDDLKYLINIKADHDLLAISKIRAMSSMLSKGSRYLPVDSLGVRKNK